MCQFFSQDLDDVPQPMNTGEILIACNMKIAYKSNPEKAQDRVAWSTQNTNYKLIGPGFNLSSLREDERARVKDLQEWWNMRGAVAGARGDIILRDKNGNPIEETGKISNKFATVSEMMENRFYDLVVEVCSTSTKCLVCEPFFE